MSSSMPVKILSSFLVVTFFVFFLACSNGKTQENSAITNVNNTTSETVKTPETPTESNVEKSETTQNNECSEVKRKGFALDKKQTFAIDFAPFEKSCFAVFHDPEFTSPALGAQFFIYKNGKEILNFPEQFNGGNALCWVDAVSFEDVNDDRFKDVIVIGKCGAKSDDYNENMVYINTGKEFKINKDANMEMMDYTKISQIQDYVRKHQENFTK
jgi:hypothetical protein